MTETAPAPRVDRTFGKLQVGDVLLPVSMYGTRRTVLTSPQPAEGMPGSVAYRVRFDNGTEADLISNSRSRHMVEPVTVPCAGCDVPIYATGRPKPEAYAHTARVSAPHQPTPRRADYQPPEVRDAAREAAEGEQLELDQRRADAFLFELRRLARAVDSINDPRTVRFEDSARDLARTFADFDVHLERGGLLPGAWARG